MKAAKDFMPPFLFHKSILIDVNGNINVVYGIMLSVCSIVVLSFSNDPWFISFGVILIISGIFLWFSSYLIVFNIDDMSITRMLEISGIVIFMQKMFMNIFSEVIFSEIYHEYPFTAY
jgi:hypothetical protein